MELTADRYRDGAVRVLKDGWTVAWFENGPAEALTWAHKEAKATVDPSYGYALGELSRKLERLMLTDLTQVRIPSATPGHSIRFLSRQFAGGVRYEVMDGIGEVGSLRYDEHWLAEVRRENGRWAIYDDMKRRLNAVLLSSMEEVISWIELRWGSKSTPRET